MLTLVCIRRLKHSHIARFVVIGMPGGGAWALQSPQYVESGAVYLAGTKNITFDFCLFKYLDGNGIFIAGYNRNVSVTNSELTQIGDSPIALWGYTRGEVSKQHPL